MTYNSMTYDIKYSISWQHYSSTVSLLLDEGTHDPRIRKIRAVTGLRHDIQYDTYKCTFHPATPLGGAHSHLP